jgi:hypothetical protein
MDCNFTSYAPYSDASFSSSCNMPFIPEVTNALPTTQYEIDMQTRLKNISNDMDDIRAMVKQAKSSGIIENSSLCSDDNVVAGSSFLDSPLQDVNNEYMHASIVENRGDKKSIESPFENLSEELAEYRKEISFYLKNYNNPELLCNHNKEKHVDASALLRSGKETKKEIQQQQYEEEEKILKEEGIFQESKENINDEIIYEDKLEEGQESNIPIPSVENKIQEDVIEDETHLFNKEEDLIKENFQEKENETREEEVNQELIQRPTLPFPSRLKNNKNNEDNEEIQNIRQIFEQVRVNIPLLELIQQIPSYAKVLKECCIKRRRKNTPPKRVYLAELSSAYISSTLPEKLKDPGTPIISCRIGNHTFERALLDLGAGVNVMPKSVYDNLGITGVKNTKIILKLADRSTTTPIGILENVLV